MFGPGGADRDARDRDDERRARDGRELRKLEATERLVALYRLQNGEPSPEHCFTPVVTSAAEVDWEGFPLLAALEAVTFDELRRLRGLLGASAEDATPTSPAFFETRPWAVPGDGGIADETTPSR